MRKPILPRILRLLLLYFAIFTALVLIQFTKKGSFTQQAGELVITGQYRMPERNDPGRLADGYLLDGDIYVFFGGMEFGMIRGKANGNALLLTGPGGFREKALPERMVITDESALFSFPGGSELIFTTQYTGGVLELLISGVFPDGVTGMELPFKPLRKTGIRDTGDGQFMASADGINYSFGLSPMNREARTLLIGSEAGPVSYRVIPDRSAFSLNDFILPQARNAETYKEAVTRWRDQNFSLWRRIAPEQNNEDVIVALGAEALTRGAFLAALSSVSPAFLNGNNRTYESSVYLGDLEQASRSLTNLEREKLARLSRQINEKSLEFLKEYRVFEYFAVRGHLNFFDAGADLVRSIDPATLALDITPGILEGYVDWKTYRPSGDNPFERLIDQANLVISESLRRTQDNQVFAFYGRQGETEFNLRLGKALLAYAESAARQNTQSWAGIGRSLILSALSLGDASGEVKAGLLLSENGEIEENPAPSELTTARLYRILSPEDTYPRGVTIGAAVNSIWTWTAAETVSASQESNVLDIAVSFLAGETHYMIIRGIRSFSRIQLYNMDFRTDPQFERYDSSGWSYISQEQTLVVKMKHRTTVEHIRIYY